MTRTPSPIPCGPIRYRINFQGGGPPPPFYRPDRGVTFTSQPGTGGLVYGWSSFNGLGVNHYGNTEPRYDTFVRFGGRYWEIAVLNGTYQVFLASGDPTDTTGYFHIEVEGQTAIDGSPSSDRRWLEAFVTVVVADGRLTIKSLPDSVNCKINFVDIYACSSLPEPTPTNTFTRSITMTPTEAICNTCGLDAWTQETISGGFGNLGDQENLVFNDQIWLIAGDDDVDYVSNIWSSNNGINYTLVTTSPGFSPRSGHAAVVYNDKMWVIGGNLNTDVWSSNNGMNWYAITANGGFTASQLSDAVSFNNKMYYFPGGQEVWSSTDGSTWDLETGIAEFGVRDYPAIAVYNGLIWVVGGLNGSMYLNDVWSSSNGISWSLVTSSAPFTGRSRSLLTVYGSRLYLIAGTTSDNYFNDEIWCTNDGLNWDLVDSIPAFSPRVVSNPVVYLNRIWINGGMQYGTRFSDVWSSYCP
jgi:hypothetical protein